MNNHHIPHKPDHGLLLKLCKEYYQHDGKLYRKVGNKEVCTLNPVINRYRLVLRHKGEQHTLYRYHIVWFLCKGKWPEQQIDHKDLNRTNDRIDNLREANCSLNALNSSNRLTMPPGVHYDKDYDRYNVSIKLKGDYINLGIFYNIEDAAKAYEERYKAEYNEPLPKLYRDDYKIENLMKDLT